MEEISTQLTRAVDSLEKAERLSFSLFKETENPKVRKFIEETNIAIEEHLTDVFFLNQEFKVVLS